MDDKALEFRLAIEELIVNYQSNEGNNITMPMLEDWFLVATINDLDDNSNGKWLYMRGDKQSTHRSIGLLVMASDYLRGIEPSD